MQSETIYETEKGWYVFRDYDDGGYGMYLFKVFQYTEHEEKIYGQWTAPCLPYAGGPVAEYFGSKEETIIAMAKVTEAIKEQIAV